ncbi:ribosomal protein S16 [Rhodofomes roseus]|uniref:Ribosomal protein S16 n=1 Tax=Rhodofomes roseus TaxID=34475 RepID=A0ABQ8KGQ3_9APHY|nr:ribosomal protein S16 [Rhodofomes roseus]KAH9837033.1 ribosomal protein S16 [Rhodofomes roseus]
MVVRLRISLHGPRNNKTHRLVAIDGSARRNAHPIEVLGMWNPRTQLGETTKTVRWSVERIRYWLGVGAQPSKTVQELLDLARIQPPAAKTSHSEASEASKPAQSS